MASLDDERVLMRIYVGALDRHEGRPLFAAVVDRLREKGLAGATVLRAIMAFGSRRRLHDQSNEVASMDLPVVVECVDRAGRIDQILPEIDGMMKSGLITLERAEVVIHRPPSRGRAGDDAATVGERDVPPPADGHRVGPADVMGELEAGATTRTEVGMEVPMHGMKGERTLMRIHIGESDRHGSVALYEAIVDLLRRRGYAGATVFRGVMGFGAHAQLHVGKLLRMSSDLPIVVECIETEERIEAILPELDAMIDGGLITLERARVILYRPDVPAAERQGKWATDVTGRWQPGPEKP